MKSVKTFLCLLLLATVPSVHADAGKPYVADPTPAPFCTDTSCYPNRTGWGFYTVRWRPWPAVVSPEAAPEKPTPEESLMPDLSPFETPPPEREDSQAPRPTRPQRRPERIQPRPPEETTTEEGEAAPLAPPEVPPSLTPAPFGEPSQPDLPPPLPYEIPGSPTLPDSEQDGLDDNGDDVDEFDLEPLQLRNQPRTRHDLNDPPPGLPKSLNGLSSHPSEDVPQRTHRSTPPPLLAISPSSPRQFKPPVRQFDPLVVRADYERSSTPKTIQAQASLQTSAGVDDSGRKNAWSNLFKRRR